MENYKVVFLVKMEVYIEKKSPSVLSAKQKKQTPLQLKLVTKHPF